MKIVLANPPIPHQRQADITSYPNLGILAIVAYARRELKDLEFIYLESLKIDDYGQEIAKLNPDIFGISFATGMHAESYEAIRRVHSRIPALPILCGGPHPTAMPAEVFEESPASVVVIGEGEQTFVELIRYFRENKGLSLNRIPGIAYKDADGVIHQTEPRDFLDINLLPMPAWDIIDLKEYKGAHINRMKYSTCILPSRGCPYNCVFCSNPVWKSGRPWLRLRNPELVAEEALWLYKKGIREIYIRSDELNCDRQWTLDLCKAIKRLNLSDMKFQCNIRLDIIDQKIAEAFFSINMWLVYLGIESFNQRVIDGIKKYIDISKVEDVCRILQEHKIKVYGYVMLYQAWEDKGQLQFETTEEVDNTLRCVRRLISQGLISYISWQFATAYPGSELWEIAGKYNIIRDKTYGVWDMGLRLPEVKTKDMMRQRMLGFLLQVYCGVRSGNLNWHMWRRFLNKILYIIESAFGMVRYSREK